MTLVIPVGFAHVGLRFKHELDPDPWYVTYGIDMSAANDDLEQAAITSSFAWNNTMQPFLSAAVTFQAVELKVGQDGGPPVDFELPSNNPGTSNEAKLPQNCALLVSKLTNRGGRRGKGRFFVPGLLNENDVDAVGNLNGTVRGLLNNAATEFLDRLRDPEDAQGAVTPMVLLHNSEGTSTAGAPNLVNTLVVSSLISTQRRRLR